MFGFTFVLIIHVIIAILLIIVVLLQSGRGADLGAAFGGAGQANTSRGSMTGIAKVTTGFATMFMVTCLVLAYMSAQRASDSILLDAAPVAPATSEEPATPPPAPMDMDTGEANTAPAEPFDAGMDESGEDAAAGTEMSSSEAASEAEEMVAEPEAANNDSADGEEASSDGEAMATPPTPPTPPALPNTNP